MSCETEREHIVCFFIIKKNRLKCSLTVTPREARPRPSPPPMHSVTSNRHRYPMEEEEEEEDDKRRSLPARRRS